MECAPLAALQHDELLSKRSILRLKSAGRLERRGQQIEEQNSSATIAPMVMRFYHQINTDEVFGTHKYDGRNGYRMVPATGIDGRAVTAPMMLRARRG
jgi:hypothetical protein